MTEGPVLGLDLGKDSGWGAVPRPGTSEGVEWGEIRIRMKLTDDPKEGLGEWIDQFEDVYDHVRPVALAYERPGFHGKAKSQVWIRRQEGFLLGFARERGLLIEGIHVQTVKAHARATAMPEDHKGTPSKEDMIDAAIRYGWLPEELRTKTRTDNLADALWVADALWANERFQL